MKKFIGALLFVCVLIFYGGCKPMKSLEGKEGLFAVINTSKGDIVLWHKKSKTKGKHKY